MVLLRPSHQNANLMASSREKNPQTLPSTLEAKKPDQATQNLSVYPTWAQLQLVERTMPGIKTFSIYVFSLF